MDDDQQFCLRWNNHQSTLISVFDTLLENETLVDCTLAAEGKFLKAHKVVLSACSPYFATLLQEQYDKHPIFILKDVKYQELRAMMDYMYRGEVNISQDQLAALLKAAESLQIKGLSDSRGAGGGSAPKPDHHRPVPKLGGGYTLEQTKRARIGPSSMESQEMCGGSREGSSSPSRRRRKVRRRSIENALTDIHDNSNSSQIQTASTQQQQQQQQQSNVNLTGVGAITAAASAALAAATAQLPTATTTGSGSLAAPISSTATTTNANKKTETGLKGTISTTSATVSSAVGVTAAATATGSEPSTATANASADALQQVGGGGSDMEHDLDTKIVKENHHHKQKSSSSSSGGVKDQSAGELIIEPKSEYDDEGNEETVEDLTLDDEDMGMDDMDHNAGTSQGGEGSSQGYAGWPHDRSQDELLLAPPESQQRDPQDDDIGRLVVASKSAAQQQNESRIRVRNWLMLADKSVLEKSNGNDKTETTVITTGNARTSSTQKKRTAAIVSTATVAVATTPSAPQTATTTPTTAAAPVLLTPSSTMVAAPCSSAQTVTRIGSIGRTTIACITPAGTLVSGKNHPLNNGSVGVVSAAALAAAGVELDPVDEASMPEVIEVKIENTGSSCMDDDEPGEDEELDDDEEQRDHDDGMAAGIVETEQDDDGEYNYDLRLSSPMSWAFDAVKIETEEEFEDIMSGDPGNSTEDDDDLLTTAAATTKQAAAVNTNNNRVAAAAAAAAASATGTATIAPKVMSGREAGVKLIAPSPANKRSSTALAVTSSGEVGGGLKKRVLTAQEHQMLLEQQQHLQHLQLQPNQQTLQLKLPAIPATITSISPKVVMSASAPNTSAGAAASGGEQNSKGGGGGGGSDFQSHLSNDKRYRVLIQNQRMRKESLEHSEDMIYNADIEKPWVCRNCNRNYKWKNSLKCHLKNECGQPPRYFCSKLCGYATNVHSNLKRHLNTKCRDRIDEDQKNTSGNASTFTLVLQKNE